MIDGLIQDTGYACRSLVRQPGFTLLAVIILAVGIGSSAGIFSVANAVLVQPLPYPDAERLVSLYEANLEQGMPEVYTSLPIFRDWLEQTTAFAEMSASYTPVSVVLRGQEEPARLSATLTTPAFFALTGAEAVLGRTFRADENRRPGQHRVVVLANELWRTRFGSDADIVGRVLELNGAPYTVVGVLPPRFPDFPDAGRQTDLWIPLMMLDEIQGGDFLDNRRARTIASLARLADGVTIDEARTELDTVSARLAVEYPEDNAGWTAQVRRLREQYLGDFRAPILVLIVGAGFLLLIGCANVANLLLVRSTERRRELSLRVALGASRVRLARQLLTEVLLLTLAAGSIGLALAAVGTPLILSASPVELPAFVSPRLDVAVVVASMLLAASAGLVFGLAPVLLVVRSGLCSKVAGSSAGFEAGRFGRRGGRLRRGLVVAEIATALILLVGSGLLVRSLDKLQGADVGYRAEHLLTAQVQVPAELHEQAKLGLLAGLLLERSRGVAGVQRVDLWSPHVPGEAFWYTRVRPWDQPVLADDELPSVRYHYVGPGALEGLGLRVLTGRTINEQDTVDATPVVVLSQSLAEALWPGQDPVGKTLRRWNRDAWATVVGVVEDARLGGRLGSGSDFTRDIYFSFQQEPQRDWVLLARLRSETDDQAVSAATHGDAPVKVGSTFGDDPAATTESLRAAVREVLPNLPLYDVRTMEERLGAQEATARFTTLGTGAFATVALLLACTGVYGVLSYSVSCCAREIGVRMALGADTERVLREVVRGGLRLAAAGVAIGLVGALGAGRLLSSELYEVSPADAITFAVVPALLLVVTVLACLFPAWRASRVDPMKALRS